MESPRPAEGTHLFMLGDEAVLYSHGAQTIYLFNAAAGLIWSSLELGMDRATMAADLARALGSTPDEAREHIEACLADWAQLGILSGFEQPAPNPSPPPLAIGPSADYPLLRERSWLIERRYRLLNTVIRVRYEALEQETWIHPVLAHLEVSSASPVITVSVTHDGDRYYVHVDGRPSGRCSRLERLAPRVKAAIWQAAVGQHR